MMESALVFARQHPFDRNGGCYGDLDEFFHLVTEPFLC
jgi:hypothetical protein